MASTNEEETVAPATAEQLGSMSLGESAERKDGPTSKNETPTKKLCSACGKKSDTVKLCNGCQCIWYCDKKCQNKHRKEHKKECRPIKKELDERREGKIHFFEELDVGPLGEVPLQEECPICIQAFPLHPALRSHSTCCGKMICGACDHQHSLKSEERKTCAFCRSPVPDHEEYLAQLRKRVELKDPNALHNMALHYKDGYIGLPVDQARCIDLLRESADLGCSSAQYQLGSFYLRGWMGLEQDEKEALRHMEKAAEGGHSVARHELGCAGGRKDNAMRNGNDATAMRHFRLSASGGYRKSVEILIDFFAVGSLRHCDLAESLQAYYLARSDMRSKDRDQHIAYLKMTGKYKEEYDL